MVGRSWQIYGIMLLSSILSLFSAHDLRSLRPRARKTQRQNGEPRHEVNEADRMILWAEMDADNTGHVTKDEFEDGRRLGSLGGVDLKNNGVFLEDDLVLFMYTYIYA